LYVARNCPIKAISNSVIVAITRKKQRFIEAYLETWNITKAATVAGYANPMQHGWRVIQDPEVQAAISARLAEAAMTANEVLHRLAQHARGDIADCFSVNDAGGAYLDLDKVVKQGKSHLIKSVKHTRYGLNVELYDAQAALKLIGQHHGVLKENVSHSGEIEHKHNLGWTDEE